MGKISSEEYHVKYYEVDCKRRLLVSSLINYFSDICMVQLGETGYSLDTMNELNRAWILYKWDINIKRYPMYGERVIVSTEAYSFRKFYACRKFKVVDKDGNEIVNAKSVWFFIDTNKRRPMKITEEMYKCYEIPDDKNDILEMSKIEKCTSYAYERDFNVRYSDIDTNNHVNNAKYLSWMLETVPLEVVSEYRLENVRIDYEKETYYGEMIKAETEVEKLDNGNISCVHRIIGEGGRELTLGSSIWVKN